MFFLICRNILIRSKDIQILALKREILRHWTDIADGWFYWVKREHFCNFFKGIPKLDLGYRRSSDTMSRNEIKQALKATYVQVQRNKW